MENQTMLEEHERIELRSEEVQEILGTPPRWIVRWGTTVALLVLVLLAIVSYIIKYPDVIRATVVLTTAIPPESVIAKTNAQISELLVEDKDLVTKGTLLAILQSTADYDDMMLLDSEIQTLESMDDSELQTYRPLLSLNLGQEVQISYSSFIEDFEEYMYEINSSNDITNIQQLRNQIATLNKSIKNNKSRLKNAQNELSLEIETFERLKKLYLKGTTRQQLTDARKIVESKENNVKVIKGLIHDDELRIQEINKDILRISQNKDQLQSNRLVMVREGVKRVRSSIDKWKQIHLITAPKDGLVSYPTFGRERRFVKTGEEVMAVVPENQDSIVGKVLLNIAGSGKVKEGQKVIIKFDSYPYTEFGSVIGKVESTSLLPKDQQYLVEISLKNGLVTTYKKKLDFQQEMQGSAEIITEERRFVERIFDRFLALFEEY